MKALFLCIITLNQPEHSIVRVLFENVGKPEWNNCARKYNVQTNDSLHVIKNKIWNTFACNSN